MKKNLENILEALLFVSGSAVSVKDIQDKLEVSEQEIWQSAQILKEKYAGVSGLHLLIFSDKLQFSTNPSYATPVAAVLNPIKERELSQSMMEALAIIAYKQPATRAEIEEIRGVNGDYALAMLLKLNLIEIAGRKNAVGKPLLYRTADVFLKRFQLDDIKNLPDYATLLERIKVIEAESGRDQSGDLYRSNRDVRQEDIT
jgi:segregation and condensation protein B